MKYKLGFIFFLSISIRLLQLVVQTIQCFAFVSENLATSVSRQTVAAKQCTSQIYRSLPVPSGRQFSSTDRTKEPGSTTPANLNEFRQREEQRDHDDANDKCDNTAAPPEDGENVRVAAIRESILDASLPFVAQYGWSREAIENGAKSINYPGIAHGLFPAGAFDLIQHFAKGCDRKMVELLTEKQPDDQPTEDAKRSSLPAELEFVARAIRIRLQLQEPVQDQWPAALGTRALPPNAPAAVSQTMRMVDEICYLAGDRSADIKWYTRRIGVATLYKMCELHWVQDKSAGKQDTWAFLERRIAEIDRLQSVTGDGTKAIEQLANVARNVFETTRNALGLQGRN